MSSSQSLGLVHIQHWPALTLRFPWRRPQKRCKSLNGTIALVRSWWQKENISLAGIAKISLSRGEK